MKYCIGIDVGGTTVKLGFFDEEGNLLEKWEIPTRTEDHGKNILPDVAASILDKMKEREVSREEIAGVGIGAPGPIDAKGTVYVAVNLGWGTFSLKNELQSLLNLPVEAGNDANVAALGEMWLGAGMGVPGPVVANGYVDVCVNLGLHKCYPGDDLSKALGGVKVCLGNDANVAALGEMWQGAGKGHNSICMVTLGTGVGGGLVNEGHMISGVHGLAGEIGHMHVQDEEPEVCNCGGHGCLEQYASATGIVRVAKRTLARTRRASAMRDFGEKLSAKNVCDCAKAGDQVALESIRYSMRKLAMVMSHIAMGTDPKLFVIGGGVSRAGSFLTDMIGEYLRDYTPMIADDPDEVVLAELGNDAGIYGAAKLVLED